MSLRSFRRRWIIVAWLGWACNACSGAESSKAANTDPANTADAASTACTDATQCPSGFGCAYPVGGGCGAAGTCRPFQGCVDGQVCACDGTVTQACGFTDYGFAPKPTPAAPFSPPIPTQGVDMGAYCMYAAAHASDAGCGADVPLYDCASVAADGGGCLALDDGGSADVRYPASCVAYLPGCGAATVPPSSVTCDCVVGDAAPPGSGGAGWVCPL